MIMRKFRLTIQEHEGESVHQDFDISASIPISVKELLNSATQGIVAEQEPIMGRIQMVNYEREI